jgi:Putative beta-barrel porin-2, OmpL-like. bbp2
MKATRTKRIIAAIISVTFLSAGALAQQASEIRPKPANATVVSSASLPAAAGASSESTEHERLLLDRIEKLERRLAELEYRGESKTIREPLQPASTAAAPGQPLEGTAKTQDKAASEPQQISKEDRGVLDFLRDTTFNVTLDGYYGYNFNKPIGRINLLRAYDVMSNSFSLNQAAVVIERAPNVEAGRRFGVRLDLQYGQATETLQGSAANELRPQAYRPVFQAYGTYVAPVGSGLTVDFGKWASAFGIENNYTKDQMNYSRSYYFNFLPFYHTGFRTSYNVNDKLSVSYWLVNGIQQSEDFNGFKSQAILFTIKPSSKLSWSVNYYTGIEGRDEVPALNPGLPALPTQPGLPTEIIQPVPHGRTHIFDTYATWNVTAKLTLAAEGDYFVSRGTKDSPPSRFAGGAAYARYQLTPKAAVAGRAEYLSDRGGLFSGVTQALKETTLTFDYKLADGFLVRSEWRRDFSNRPFFLTDTPGLLKRDQKTATVGLIWWFGRKEGSW